MVAEGLPSIAATTELTPMASPVTQRTTAKAMVPSMIFSSLLMGPIFCSRSAAAAGACGVSFISGGHSCMPIRQIKVQCSHYSMLLHSCMPIRHIEVQCSHDSMLLHSRRPITQKLIELTVTTTDCNIYCTTACPSHKC